MTLAQLSALVDADASFNDPNRQEDEEGSLADLLALAHMKLA